MNGTLEVREMTLDEVAVRIDYFHGSSDEHLHQLGVDRSLLPTKQEWAAFYEADYARPIEERRNCSLLWLLDGETVGFGSTDRIEFGDQAFMHLHIVSEAQRRKGLGTEFVKRSSAVFFEQLELVQLICEPNALNVAPNRALQAAGFRYVYSHHTVPGPTNFPQVVTRWLLNRSPSDAFSSSRADP